MAKKMSSINYLGLRKKQSLLSNANVALKCMKVESFDVVKKYFQRLQIRTVVAALDMYESDPLAVYVPHAMLNYFT